MAIAEALSCSSSLAAVCIGRYLVFQLKDEVQTYSAQQKSLTSSGIRLELWLKAIGIISAHPLAGLGVGSWSTEYNRLEHEKNAAHVAINGNGNSHQEYLQWGVQLGLPGIVLLFGLFGSVFRDTWAMEPAVARTAQSALAAFMVACLFNSSLYDALIGDFFCVTLGLLLALGANGKLTAGVMLPINGRTV